MFTSLSQTKVDNQDYFRDGLNEALKEAYCKEYNGGMVVYKGEGIYTLAMHLANADNPQILAGDFPNDASFLDYICKEIIGKRMFVTTVYGRLNRVYNHDRK